METRLLVRSVLARYAPTLLQTQSRGTILACSLCPRSSRKQTSPPSSRTFTTSVTRTNWLLPNIKKKHKTSRGAPRMPTGGSTRGTTIIWGDYGLRMRDHDRFVTAAQFKNGEDVIRRRMRGTNFRLFTRVHAGTAVYEKGNESRMGTGKGSFDHWAARVSVSRVIFELKADAHEQVIKDAFRLAANKMPGLYEFIRKGDSPVMGITKLGPGITEEDLKRPRKKLPGEIRAGRLQGAAASALPSNNPGPAAPA